MTSKSDFEIPDSLRDLAGKSVDQARKAYDDFLAQSRKAQEMVTRSSAAMNATAKEVQARAMQYTEENMKTGFELADRLTKASSIREALEIQSEYARKQMEVYSRQAKELTSLMTKSGQPKAE